MNNPNFLLRIENLSVGYGMDEVLSVEQLHIPEHSITAIMGPSGSGKSTLFGTITQVNNIPSYWKKGEVFLRDEPLIEANAEAKIASIAQKARLYTGSILENFIDGLDTGGTTTAEAQRALAEQHLRKLGLWGQFSELLDAPAIDQSMGMHKMLLIARASARNPELLLLDEPLADTSLAEETALVELILRLKQYTTVCVITHNKDEAQKYSDYIALISGGMLHEFTAAKEFFRTPQTEIGHQFLNSGSAWYVREQPLEPVDEETLPANERLAALRRFSSVNEFFWVKSDLIGGMQRPGLLTDIDKDLKIMRQLGVQNLVSLTQQPIDPVLLAKNRIKGIHFPIVDMDIPTLPETLEMVRQCAALVTAGESVVFHCKAGMGRTGTLLACMLVWVEDISAIRAIEKIRNINHKYIQTDEQYAFVSDFERYLKASDAANARL